MTPGRRRLRPPTIVFNAAELGERPERAAAAGRARRITRGVYTTDLSRPLAELVRAHVWEIVGNIIPDALIADRSAGPTMFVSDTLFVVSQQRARDVSLPGLRVAVRRGHPPLPDDMPWSGGLRRSSIPRALVENLAPSRARGGPSRTLSHEELTDWVGQLALQHPPERLNRVRDRAREIAEQLGHADRFPRLDRLFGAALGIRPVRARATLLAAGAAGKAWDPVRIAKFARLAEQLHALDPSALDLPDAMPVGSSERLTEQPFFEAYFSNFIEGTEFELDEAARIVHRREVPAHRPADGHDVLSTFELIADPDEARRTPVGGPDLVEILRQRHARLMGARPEVRPGEFKRVSNRVGSYTFVEPELVRGTLARGLGPRDELPSGFARAVYLMFLVSEVHPFDDGNGRLARLAMNAELSAAGQVRILIPLILRNDYLAALRRLSRDEDAQLLCRVLGRAWRWSAEIDFSSLAATRGMLDATNALVDAPDAERTGRHLLLPHEILT
jgi:hypothetical protein